MLGQVWSRLEQGGGQGRKWGGSQSCTHLSPFPSQKLTLPLLGFISAKCLPWVQGLSFAIRKFISKVVISKSYFTYLSLAVRLPLNPLAQLYYGG